MSKPRSKPTIRPVELATGDQTSPPAADPAEPAAEPAQVAEPATAAELTTRPPAPVRAPARHPNLGLAPLDMSAGFPQAATKLRAATTLLATKSLKAVVTADPTLTERHTEVELRRLLRDGELLAERLAMCLGSANARWLTEYAEWVAPVYRRRGISLLDLAALCDALGTVAAAVLTPEEVEFANQSLAATTAILRRNSRLAGDRHKRNALWKWMYKGV